MDRNSVMNRPNVKLLLADGESHIRHGLRNALNAEGYRDTRAVGYIEVVHDILSDSTPDAVIIDGDLPDGDALALTRDIRNGVVGGNPFLPIILMTWDSCAGRVRRAIDRGIDLILVKPFAPADLLLRINGVAFHRRPFLMTADYVGPTRRKERRRGDTGCFEVPNTLKSRLEGNVVNPDDLSEHIEKSKQQMNASRVEKAALILARAVAQVCAVYENYEVSDELGDSLQKILKYTDALRRHGPKKMDPLCRTLANIVTNIRHEPEDADTKQIELLWPLSQSILLAAKRDVDTGVIMKEVSNVMSYCRTSSEFLGHFHIHDKRVCGSLA